MARRFFRSSSPDKNPISTSANNSKDTCSEIKYVNGYLDGAGHMTRNIPPNFQRVRDIFYDSSSPLKKQWVIKLINKTIDIKHMEYVLHPESVSASLGVMTVGGCIEAIHTLDITVSDENIGRVRVQPGGSGYFLNKTMDLPIAFEKCVVFNTSTQEQFDLN